MKSKTTTQSITFILLAGFLLGAIPAFAQADYDRDDAARPTLFNENDFEDRDEYKPSVMPIKANFPAYRAESKEDRIEVLERIKDGRSEIEDIRNEAKADIATFRAETKEALENAETREDRKAILEEAKIETKNNKIEIRELTSEKKAEIRSSQKFLFAKQFVLIHAKLQRAVEGIENRMIKMSEDGMDISKAESLVAEAKLNLGSAGDIMEKMKSLLDSRPETKEASEALRTELKALAEDLKGSLRSAHGNLKEAVNVLRELKN